MKLSQLKNMVENMLNVYDENMLVVFKPENSSYVEGIDSYYYDCEVRKFYGEDKEMIIVESTGQIGMI